MDSGCGTGQPGPALARLSRSIIRGQRQARRCPASEVKVATGRVLCHIMKAVMSPVRSLAVILR
jgi:hypothetical protein